MISVVVPLRGEPAPREEVLAPLRKASLVELRVAADPSTPDGTLAAWKKEGAIVTVSDEPRGARLNAAARSALGETLLFLHADTLLPDGWAEDVRWAVNQGAVGGAFRLAFTGTDPRMRLVSAAANMRTALTKVPYGDQAPFVRRDFFERLGGFRPWPLLEDVDFGRRARRIGRIALLPRPVETSPRRYLELGVARTVLANWSILLRWRLGTPSEELAREYHGRPGSPGSS